LFEVDAEVPSLPSSLPPRNQVESQSSASPSSESLGFLLFFGTRRRSRERPLLLYPNSSNSVVLLWQRGIGYVCELLPFLPDHGKGRKSTKFPLPPYRKASLSSPSGHLVGNSQSSAFSLEGRGRSSLYLISLLRGKRIDESPGGRCFPRDGRRTRFSSSRGRDIPCRAEGETFLASFFFGITIFPVAWPRAKALS